MGVRVCVQGILNRENRSTDMWTVAWRENLPPPATHTHIYLYKYKHKYIAQKNYEDISL